MIRQIAILLLLVPSLIGVARADNNSPIVVELFTSQGCSSCPPADKFLGQLAKRPGILPLGFHVAYWNYIGWTDPYSKPWAARRQREYAKRLEQRFVYTPEMVVQGEFEGVGSERGKIDALIRAAEVHRSPHPDLVLHWRADGTLVAKVGAGKAPPRDPATLWLVGYDHLHETKIEAGENAGRIARDHRVVRSFSRLGDWNGKAETLVVPADQARYLGDGGVAVLLQKYDTGPILTAASIAMPRE